MTPHTGTNQAGSWSGRTVLVTGAEGFVGSTLTEHLLHAGARVRALAHYKPYGTRGFLAPIADELEDRRRGRARQWARHGRCRRLRGRLPPRSADRDPVQLLPWSANRLLTW